MTPERRKEIQRSEDASYRTRTSREIDELKERIKALESLLSDTVLDLQEWMFVYGRSPVSEKLIIRADAMLPKSEEVK